MVQNYISKYPLISIIVFSLCFNALLWFGALVFARNQDSAAVLHYSTAVGIDFIGEAKQITTLPIVGLIILVGNSVIGLLLAKNDSRTAWILWSIIPLAQVITICAFILIWLFNP